MGNGKTRRADQLQQYLRDTATNAGFREDRLDKGLEHFAAVLFAQEEGLNILEGESWDSREAQRAVQRFVCGGPNDGGFDVILHSEPPEMVTIIQAKYSAKKIPRQTLEDAVNGLISSFRDMKFKENRKRLSESARELVENSEMSRKGTRVNLYVVTNQPVGDLELAQYCSLKEEELRQAGREVEVAVFGSAELLAQRDQFELAENGETVKELEIQLPREFNFMYESGDARAVVALVKLATVATWWKRYKNALFNLNIRGYLAGSKLNRSVVETATGDPENFSFYNNGITATCSSFEILEKNRLVAHDVQVVNGAQTVKSIFVAEQDCDSRTREHFGNGYVLLRLIETGKRNRNKSEFADKITRYQNTQNKVLESDFFSNDLIQVFLEQELANWSGHKNFVAPFWYERKRGFGRQANKQKITIKTLGSLRHALLHGPRVSYVEPKTLWDVDRVRYWEAFGVQTRVDEDNQNLYGECATWDREEVAKVVWAIHTWRHLRTLPEEEQLSDGAHEKTYLTYMANYVVALTSVAVQYSISQGWIKSYSAIMDSQDHWTRYTSPFLAVARLKVNEQVHVMRQKEIRSPLLIAGDAAIWTLLRDSVTNSTKLEGREKINRQM
jgi:hypothetical protein